MSGSKQRQKNAPSLLLRDDENESLFALLGRGCMTLASGVIQLYLAEAPMRQRWGKRVTGIACFIKDNPKRSYFIRVYDLKSRQCVWEQEIYNQFRYKSPRDYFHTFEAETAQAGLNFASEDEAAKFKTSVEQKLLERHKRRMEKRNQQKSQNIPSTQARQAQVNTAPVEQPTPAAQPISSINISSGSNTVKESKKNKTKDKKKKLTKEDIGTPSNFRHVNHVGWDPEKGFEMEKLDEDMKNLFYSVGISDNDVVDKETIDFIYDFVEKNGGIEQVKKEMKIGPPPPPPPSAQPPPPPSSQQHRPPPGPPSMPPRGPPPPPARQQAPPPTRPMKTSMGAPPPPQRERQLPPTPPFKGPSSPPPPPVGVPNAPPPPPAPAPPPPPPAPGAPPPPPMGGGAGRGALLESIRDGTSLKKSTPNESRSSGGDARDNLLNAIKQGKNLKHVEHQADSRPAVVEEQGGIVGALAKALASRSAQIQGSDNDSDESDIDDDDDEWDD